MNDRPMGLIKDMSFADYHAVDAMSASGMRQLARSPWHYRNRVPTIPTRAMLNGTLAHCAVLEPDTLVSRYVVTPDDAPRRPTAAQWNAKKPSPDSIAAMAWWTDFKRKCEGRDIVAAEDYSITQQQLDAISADIELSELFSVGYSESSLFWVDKKTGVYCKARPDHVRIDSNTVKMADLKTTADDRPAMFGKSAASMGHHRQRAHYINGFERITGCHVTDFVFAVVSSVPPVLAVPYRLVDEVVQQGEDECAELLELYAECCKRDHWPSYSPAERMIDFPKYAKRSQEVEVGWAS